MIWASWTFWAVIASRRDEARRRKPAKTWGGGEGGREGEGGIGSTPWVAESDPPSQQRLTSECVRCVGWRAGWMGRGGEGVGGNWRGVALTHQATVYKNKTCGQGNGTVFFIHLLPLPKGLRKQQKKWHMFHLWRRSPSLCFFSSLSLTHSLVYSSKFPSLH